MNIMERFFENEIFMDSEAELWYGDDQAYTDYPVRFPTVDIGLAATDGLIKIADSIRMERGYKPMLPAGEYNGDTCDLDGWYDFNVRLNGFSDTRIDNCITFTVVNSDSADNEETYDIDLTEEQQIELYNRLNGQCVKYYEKTCAELLAEAQRELDELIEYENRTEKNA